MTTKDAVQVYELLEKGKLLEKDGDLEGCERIYQKALSIAPDDSRVLNRMGLLSYRSCRLKQAEALIQQAIEQEPKCWKYHKNLGNILRQLHRFEAARDSFNRALALNPASTEANYDLGILYQTNGQLEKALACYNRCISLQPLYPQAYNNAGLIYMKQNQTLAAKNCFELAVQQDFSFAGAHLNLGVLHQKEGNYQKSLICFQTAARYAPNMPDAYRCMGQVFQSLGKADEAIGCYARVTLIHPKSAVDWVNLGTAHHDNLSLDKAMQCYQKALFIDPKLPQALLNAGIVHRERHQYAEALACFKNALKSKVDYDNALAQLVALLIQLCDWKSLQKYNAMLDRATEKAIAANKKPDETPFLNVIRKKQPMHNFQVANAWSLQTKSDAARWNQRFDQNGRRKKKRLLRIGYLSANFQNHPTSELIVGLLKGHNRNRYEVSAYSYGMDDGSIQRKKIVDACDRFNDIYRVKDKKAADLIYGDEVDILVDLMGYTKGVRMQICANRPAPVQVRYLGMAGTTGANFFDYIIVDRTVCPIEHEPFYSEKPVYMPFSYQVNNYANRRADNSMKAFEHHTGKPFVFCCFSTAYKIDAAVFRTWMNIMLRVPDSILWLMPGNKMVEKHFREAADLMGVDHERIICKEKLPIDKHLERLKNAHLALDTLTVNGAATTSDALWSGLPVLTIKGSHFASKMSESLLRSVGLLEMVAADLHQYEEMAVHLALSPDTLMGIREKLIARRKSSPLFDSDLFVRHIETAYELMWKRFLNNEKPAEIDLSAHVD